MKKYRVSIDLKNLAAIFFVLISIAGCQDNSNSDIRADSPKIVGDFPLKEHWRKDFDSELKAMALGSGMLITGIIDDDGAVIQAFDIATGSSLWKNVLPGNSIDIKIMVVDKSVYVIYAPKLFAMDLNTGDLIFETDIRASSGDEIAAFTDNHIFVIQISEGVYAYDRYTGKLSWQILVGRGNVNVFPAVIATRQLVYIIHGEYLKAVNERDGSLVWQRQIGFHGPAGYAGYRDGILYYSTSNIHYSSNNKIQEEAGTQILALDLGTNSQLWENELGNQGECMATENDGIITITTETIAMSDLKSGEKVWEYYIPLEVYCPPVIMEGVIYLKDFFTNQVIAMKQENGALLGRLDFEDSGWFGYKIPTDNLLSSIEPFPVLAFYSKNSVYVFK